MKRSRLATLLALFTAALVLLSACGGGAAPAAEPTKAPEAAPAPAEATKAPEPAPAEPTKAPEPAPAAEATKIVIWNTGSEDDAKALQIAADAFTKANPTITFDIQPVPWSDAYAKILASVAGGVAPDVITGGMSWGIEFGKQGGMIDLKAKYPETTNKIVAMLPPQVANAIIPPSGEVYAVQLDVTMHEMFYRTDLIEKAPATWEELTAAIEKAQADGKKGFQLDWGIADWLGMYPFVYSAGGSYYDAGCTKATINSPEAITGLKFFASLYSKYKAPTDSVDIGNGLESGDYPIAIGGSWNAAGLEYARPNLAGKWGVAPLPAGPSGKAVSFLGGKIIGVMASSKNADASVKFIEYLYTADAVKAQADYQKTKNNFFIPPAAELLPAAGLPASVEPGVKQILAAAGGPPNCPGWEAVQADVVKLIQEVIYNGADPQAKMDEAAKLMTDALTK